jgi:hypothetical protein
MNYLKTAYTSGIMEPFDRIDLRGIRFKQFGSGDSATFGPFIRLLDDDQTNWHAWAQYEVYDMLKGDSHCGNVEIPVPFWFNPIEKVDNNDYGYTVTHPNVGSKSCSGTQHSRFDIFTNETYLDSRAIFAAKGNLIDFSPFYSPFNTLDEAVNFKEEKTQCFFVYNTTMAASKDIQSAMNRIGAMYNTLWDINKIAFEHEACYVIDAAWQNWMEHYQGWGGVQINGNLSQLMSKPKTRAAYYNGHGMDEATSIWMFDLMKYLNNYYYEYVKPAVYSVPEQQMRIKLNGFYPSWPGDLYGKNVGNKTISFTIDNPYKN